MPARITGTVSKWLNHKGIGFITPEGQESVEGEDIIVHFSEIKQEGKFKSLARGSTVEFEYKEDEKSSKGKVAANVTGPNGEDCEARKRLPKPKKEKEESSDEEKQETSEKPKRKGKGKGKGRKGKGKGKRAAAEKKSEEE